MTICLLESFCANHKVAIKRILMAKCGSCAGQACIAIDYMLAERKSTPTLV
jgi:aldehyde dehydrogenase (NAD+)